MLKFVLYFFFFYAIYKILGLVAKELLRRWLADKMANAQRSGMFTEQRPSATSRPEGEIRVEKKPSYDSSDYIDYEEVK